jgi:hypothetical protein
MERLFKWGTNIQVVAAAYEDHKLIVSVTIQI